VIKDLFKIWAKLRDHTLEIRNPRTKFKSYKNLGTKYDFSGLLLLDQGPPKVSFFPEPDQSRIISLVTKHGIIYCLEAAIYYDDPTENTVDKVHYHNHHQDY
jgi:hypothetical protein